MNTVPAGLILVLIFVAQLCDALRMINLDAPESAFQGDTIQLSCFFSLGTLNLDKQDIDSKSTQAQFKPAFASDKFKYNSSLSDHFHANKHSTGNEPELLYAIKWYKNEREFFRFLAQDWPHKQALPMDGVQVDVQRSDNHTVVIRNVSLKTSGHFKCEVSTDAPSFTTKFIEKRMSVYSLPGEGPVIELNGHPVSRVGNNLDLHYALGDNLELNCVASESKPAVAIDWILNDMLNLSSVTQLRAVESIFSVENRRTVRLPTISGVISTEDMDHKDSSKRHIVKPVSPLTYTTYEILNDTFAVAESRNSVAAPAVLGLANVLDQLLELSSSRLNFTIGPDLLQALGLQVNSTVQNHLPSNHLIRSRETQALSEGATNVAVAQHNSSVISKRDKDYESTTRRRVSGFTAWKQRTATDYRSNGINKSDFRNSRRKPAPQSTRENKVLKVKCVARVLHLVMSEEIKLQIPDKSRSWTSAYSSARDSHEQDKLSQGSSGGIFRTRLDYACAILFLSMSTILTLHQSMEFFLA